MPKAPLYDREGNRIGEIDLDEKVSLFESRAFLHQVVRDAVTTESKACSAKTISGPEAAGSLGGKRPGRARHGSIRFRRLAEV